MPKYHIYALGNALVDYEFPVEDEDLQELGIEKGCMTLIDDQRRRELLDQLSSRPHNRACGGSAANTLITATQLGARCFYSCRVAEDPTGRFYSEDLRANRVDSNLRIGDLGEGSSGTCIVLVTPDAERSMCTCLGVSAQLDHSALDEAALRDSRWLYVEGYLVSSPSAHQAALQAMESARNAGVRRALTFSDINMLRFFRTQMDALVDLGLDLLFANEAEALEYTGADTLMDAVGQLQTLAPAGVITRGPRGAMCWEAGRLLEVPAPQVRAIDTNGAGDTFAGVFLESLARDGCDLEESARRAAIAASRLVTHFGPRLPREDIEDLQRNIFV